MGWAPANEWGSANLALGRNMGPRGRNQASLITHSLDWKHKEVVEGTRRCRNGKDGG